VFHALPPPFNSIVPFVIVLGVLVFFHELGHYAVARWVGVHVETFAIGFGRAIATWKDRVGTVWKVGWLPLGGYVKLHGQEQPQNATDEERANWISGRTFHEKHVAARAAVVAAGPIANFLLAAVLFSVLFAAVGRPRILPEVGQVVAGSAAEHAGLQPGDRILTIDGAPMSRFEDVQRAISTRPAEQVTLTVRRGETEQTLNFVTDARERDGQRIGSLGVMARGAEYDRLSPVQAVAQGFAHTWDVGVQTLEGVWGMIAHGRGASELGGPLRIAQLSGEVAQVGVASLIDFIAVLSINLGLINLFPIPILDGGHLVFFAFEAVRGRPLPQRAVEYGMRAGLALLVCLFVFATWNDVTRIPWLSFGPLRWVIGG
jgi:regulator of sigma E protease